VPIVNNDNDNDLNAVIAAGLIQPGMPLERIRAALLSVEVPRAAALIRQHKVSHIARTRIESMCADTGQIDGADARLRDLHARITGTRVAMDDRVATADPLLADLARELPDLPVLLMKGLAVRHWYPAHLRRDVGDADLWTPDIDSGWALVGALRDRGYEYESGELPWLKGDLRGRLFGQVRLVDPHAGRVSVDVHMGPYSVRYCGMLRFDKSARSRPWGPMALEDNFCAVLANAAGDCFIDAKTINDTILALDPAMPCAAAAGDGLDLSYLRDRLAAAELDEFLAAVLDSAKAHCVLGPDQCANLAALRGEHRAERLSIGLQPDPALRIELVAEHARRAALRLIGEPARADTISREAHTAYSLGKRYRLVRNRPGRGALPGLNPWTCIRLAPQPLLRGAFKRTAGEPYRVDEVATLSNELRLLRGAVGDLIRFRADTFVPTADYSFPVDLVDNPPPVDTAGPDARSARTATGVRTTGTDRPTELPEALFDAEFRRQVFGRTHRHFRGAPDRFDTLFGWTDLNTILACHRLRAPQLRLVREGTTLPEAAYVRTESRRRNRVVVDLDPARVQAALADGHTLALRYVDELHPGLATFASRYEHLLNAPFELNLYATWTASEGFGAHWDDHDVFVHQLSGVKRWRLYGRSADSLAPRSGRSAPRPPEPVDEVLLAPGDVLYLPRGHWHAPACVEPPSLHLTGSLPAVTGADLVSWLVTQLRTSPSLCADVPRFGDPQERATFVEELRSALVAAWAEPGLVDRFLAEGAATTSRSRFSLPEVHT
jgi:hypothetical protein